MSKKPDDHPRVFQPPRPTVQPPIVQPPIVQPMIDELRGGPRPQEDEKAPPPGPLHPPQPADVNPEPDEPATEPHHDRPYARD